MKMKNSFKRNEVSVNNNNVHLIQKPNNKGFTLVEVLLVIALLAISVGVTSDIVLTLIRSYVKTSVANDIEQNANFVSLKLENELKVATGICAHSYNFIQFTTSAHNDCTGTNNITYTVKNHGSPSVMSIMRSVGGVELPLTDSNLSTGVALKACTDPEKCFEVISTGSPEVVRIQFEYTQASTTSPTPFTGVVNYDNTILLRGTY